MRIALWIGLAVLLVRCSAPETVQSSQAESLRDVKLYVKGKGWDPDRTQFEYDAHNTPWRSFWTGGLEMSPEQKKWDSRLHEVWVYQAIQPEAASHLMWIFVDRRSGQILGHLEIR